MNKTIRPTRLPKSAGLASAITIFFVGFQIILNLPGAEEPTATKESPAPYCYDYSKC